MSNVSHIYSGQSAEPEADKDSPGPLIYCMMCRHWKQSYNPAFGHCLLAGKSMAGPMATTDLTTCTRAERMPA